MSCCAPFVYTSSNILTAYYNGVVLVTSSRVGSLLHTVAILSALRRSNSITSVMVSFSVIYVMI